MSEALAILIVDAYSSGRFLPLQIRALAPTYAIAHIQSSDALPDELLRSHQKNHFDLSLGTYKSLQTVVELLGDRRVLHVIPGSEPGVELAHELAKYFRCATRNLDILADARRNKIRMQAAASTMVETVFTLGVSSILQAKECLKNGSVSFPVVVKPPKSAGTDMVSICSNPKELENALETLLGYRDKLGNIVQEVVLQEYMDGVEYCISAVAVEGNYYFTDVWKYRKCKRGRRHIYEYDELIHPAAFPELLAYAARVLTSLGVMTGPAHLEIICTKNGYRLVEVGSRLQGGVHLGSLEDALNANPIELAAAAYVQPELVESHDWNRATLPFLVPHKSLRCVHLISPRDGRFNLETAERLLSSLGSYYPGSFSPEVSDDCRIKLTTDLFSSPGFCYLVSEDRLALRRDYLHLRHLESRYFYI